MLDRHVRDGVVDYQGFKKDIGSILPSIVRPAAAGDGLNIRYLDYDWSLNGK